MAENKKAQEDAKKENEDKNESSVSMSERGEFNIPEGTEPTPGVDTTAEGLAKKYNQPLPEGVKPVLGEDVAPEQDARAKAATQEVAETTAAAGETTATPTTRKAAAAPKATATKTAAAPKKTGRGK